MSKAILAKEVTYRFYGNLDGSWNTRGEGKVIGPCIVDVKECYYVSHTHSYFVYVNGEHQCGGMIRHGYTDILEMLQCVPFEIYNGPLA